MDRIYLDYNASAPLRAGALEAMANALALPGNASSVHAEGRAARALIEGARGDIAGGLGVDPRQVTFTSGATEAANALLSPGLRDGKSGVERLIVGAGEHPCVLSGHRFAPESVDIAPIDTNGRLDLTALAHLLAAPGRPLLALQAANNETGVLQPVAEAAALAHAHGGLVVCDAVQLAGRGDSRLDTLGVDALFLSSHKLGGPKGAGAFAFAREDLHLDLPLVRGGGQERGLRGGTENIAATVGFAAAFRIAREEQDGEMERLRLLRDAMEARLRADLPDLVVFGEAAPRLANTSAFALPDISAETLLIALDIEGIAISSGSACSSGKVRPSHVLAAMGIDDHISRGALRISLGWATDAGQIDRFCETFQRIVRSMRARRKTSVRRI